MAALVQARLLLKAGENSAALALLKRFDTPSALALTRVVVAEAQHRGSPESANRELSAAARARAYGEWSAERPPVLEVVASSLPLSGRKRSSR
jgi:hypothetical protein